MDLFAGIPDSELWARAGQHDGAAFGELFNRHGTAVYNHLFRRTASWATAEELTSVVFLEAWRRRKSARLYSDSILPWLLGVANNAIRHAHRSQRRHQRLLGRLPLPPVAADFGDDAARRLDAEQAMARVLAELSDLRIEDREAIALCDWAGLGPIEAAAALGVPAGTVRSRLSRAHAQLRARLGEELIETASTSTPPIHAREEDHGRT